MAARTPADPVVDQLLAAMPVGYREMMGRMQAWTTLLVLAYADGKSERVAAIHAQIDGWRRPIWDGAPEVMPQWQSARRQAGATFEALRSLTKTDPLVSATRRQVGDGAAQMIRDHGPQVHAERVIAAAADFATNTPSAAFDGLPEQEADEASTLFSCAAAGWLFNRVFLSRESGRLALMAKIREGEQIALGVPSPEWAGDIPDAAAIALLADLLELDPAMLPPLDPRKRHLIEQDLVSTAKLHLHQHPYSSDAERAELRSRLIAMVTSFQLPERLRAPKHQPSATASAAPKPGQRPQRPAKKPRR
jgi:hypothetical protein